MPRDHRRAAQPYWPHSQPEPLPEPGPATTGEACPGFCNAAYRSAETRRETKGTPHTLTPRAGDPVWCRPCATAIRCALADLPNLAILLQLQVTGATAEDGEHVSGSKERPLYPGDAYALTIEEIAVFLGDWEDTLRRDRNLSGKRRAQERVGAAIVHACTFLTRHLDWLLAQHPERDASEGFGTDLLALYRRAQSMTKSTEVRPQRCDGVKCPVCDLSALEWEVDTAGRATGDVRCRVCRPAMVMTAGEYEQWTKMLDHDARKAGLATPRVLADAGLPR
jgi:hypothetical protein